MEEHTDKLRLEHRGKLRFWNIRVNWGGGTNVLIKMKEQRIKLGGRSRVYRNREVNWDVESQG